MNISKLLDWLKAYSIPALIFVVVLLVLFIIFQDAPQVKRWLDHERKIDVIDSVHDAKQLEVDDIVDRRKERKAVRQSEKRETERKIMENERQAEKFEIDIGNLDDAGVRDSFISKYGTDTVRANYLIVR